MLTLSKADLEISVPLCEISTQQEHHSPLFRTVADLQLMLHDSDLPCEAPGQPYFSSPAGFFKQ